MVPLRSNVIPAPSDPSTSPRPFSMHRIASLPGVVFLHTFFEHCFVFPPVCKKRTKKKEKMVWSNPVFFFFAAQPFEIPFFQGVWAEGDLVPRGLLVSLSDNLCWNHLGYRDKAFLPSWKFIYQSSNCGCQTFIIFLATTSHRNGRSLISHLSISYLVFRPHRKTIASSHASSAPDPPMSTRDRHSRDRYPSHRDDSRDGRTDRRADYDRRSPPASVWRRWFAVTLPPVLKLPIMYEPPPQESRNHAQI